MVAAGQVFKGITSREGMSFMPGRHVNDHQMRLYIEFIAIHRQDESYVDDPHLQEP